MDSSKLKEQHSAVIVLHELLTDSLILSKRSTQLRHHPGEICFPGGRWEKGDEDFYATALRELNEELGISAHRVTLIKELRLESTSLGTIIHPWLSSIESIEPYHLDIHEVSRLLRIPMALVSKRSNYEDFIIERYGKHFKSCRFICDDELVWGATARIMRQLCEAPS